MDEALLLKVSGSSGEVNTFTGCIGVDGSSEVESDSKTFQAVTLMEENAAFGLLPTTSGTLEALNRLEGPLQDPLSAAREQADCVIALRDTLSFYSCHCHTPHDRTFLCSEAVISLFEAYEKTEKRKKLHISVKLAPLQTGRFYNSNETKKDCKYKDINHWDVIRRTYYLLSCLTYFCCCCCGNV